MTGRWDRRAPLLGVAFLVVLLITFVVDGNEPQGGAAAAKVVSWYGAHHSRVQGAAYLMVVAVALGLFFFGYVRDRLAADSPGLAATAFGGALIFALGGALGAGIQLALAAHIATLSAGTALALNELFLYGNWIALNVGSTVFLLAAGMAILRGGRLPAWTGRLAVALGVISVIPVFGIDPIPMALWTLIITVVMLRRGSQNAVADRAALVHAAAGAAR
jgi:hypothetical protein